MNKPTDRIETAIACLRKASKDLRIPETERKIISANLFNLERLKKEIEYEIKICKGISDAT